MNSFIPKKISTKQAGDTGMAATLVLLIVGIISGNAVFFTIAAVVLLVNMIVPRIYIPLGYFWFSLSNVLGAIVSKIMLTLIFLLVVTPVGLLRRLLNKDTLKLRGFKKNTHSQYAVRNKIYVKADIEKPF